VIPSLYQDGIGSCLLQGCEYFHLMTFIKFPYFLFDFQIQIHGIAQKEEKNIVGSESNFCGHPHQSTY
jgi:hypothetical protein